MCLGKDAEVQPIWLFEKGYFVSEKNHVRKMIISLVHYLQLVEKSWQMQDSKTLSLLLSLKHEHIQCATLHTEKPDNIVRKMIAPPIDSLVVFHLKCLFAMLRGQYWEAFQVQNNFVQSLAKIVQEQKDENWCLPLLYVICSETRLLAQKIEKIRLTKSITDCGMSYFECHSYKWQVFFLSHSQFEFAKQEIELKPDEVLEKAAESLMTCFRICASDTRASEADTKRIGMLNLANQLLKVYFRINKIQLCKPLIRAIESLPFKDVFSLSQQITYRFFVGRKAMFDSDYKLANECLTFAFENCHRNSRKNKRLILIYLVPVKILLGYMPTKAVLEKYSLMPFWDLITAVTQGHLRNFESVLAAHETFFITAGIYLIVEKLKSLTYRNLFRNVFRILNIYQLPIEVFQTALLFMGADDMDADETQCIVANLIYEGKIKGYISYQHQKVVVSKQNPFPRLTTIS